MRISWVVGCVICFAVGLLWFPSGTGAVQTSLLCTGQGDSLWGQWLRGMLPRNDATIEKVLKVKGDCPQLAGSMDRIADVIKAEREKRRKAYDDIQFVGTGGQDEDLEDLEIQR
jgi:hypothetical protein